MSLIGGGISHSGTEGGQITESPIPHSVARVLVKMASAHPEALTRAHAGTFIDHNVEVGSHGVFLDGRKIADLADVVDTIKRDNVTEVTRQRRGTGLLARLGLIGGYFVGGLAGGYIGALACGCDSGFLPGMVAGGLSGGVAGHRSAARTTEQLIYRAP